MKTCDAIEDKHTGTCGRCKDREIAALKATLAATEHREREALAEVFKLREALSTIVTEYDAGPPYTELDWVAWKQRAEKALGK
jgi:hypothetical protein